ncbi:hypothetical protein DM02DRAFT_716696 [Periconia macrospinosa]|uniref:Uncharacterized protein n=1 Tax=Periconia macrospinosa TaxID=97972 RepID=A0A2V1E282_9PLEO|nr:hypothetical protein DM02DRAFT_716696 [Periconia macrospinosa]
MTCQFPSNFTIAENVTMADFEDSLKHSIRCSDPAQHLAMGLAAFSIAIPIQSYMSTKMAPGHILSWMPLTVMQDIGVMLQIVVLILEELGHSVNLLAKALGYMFIQIGGSLYERLFNQSGIFDAENQQRVMFRLRPRLVNARMARQALVALTASIFALKLFVLQLYGLALADSGRKQPDLAIRWCSPSFRDFTVATFVPTKEQYLWLKGTVILLSCAVVAHLALLSLTRTERFHGVKVRRPWLTMFGGVIVFIILICYGVFTNDQLPAGITEMVWVYPKSPYDALGRVCKVRLWNSGLRGVILGFSDGMFASWGSTYYGKTEL